MMTVLRQTALSCCLIFLLTGCLWHHYDVTFGNGDVVRAKTRPRLNDQGAYVFKDIQGHEVQIPKSRIRQIEAVRPYSRTSSSY